MIAANKTLQKLNLEEKNTQDLLLVEIKAHKANMLKLNETITELKIDNQSLRLQKQQVSDNAISIAIHQKALG